MGTETASAAPQSMPAALMRAAQAIVDRRNSMAANAGAPGPGGGGGSPPSGSDAGAPDATPRAPDPGARSFQGAPAQPGQLLGTIGTLTGPGADGSGYEVRHAGSGRLIAQGGSAQEAQGRAQDLAGWLGRRRMVNWLKSDSELPAPSNGGNIDQSATNSSNSKGGGGSANPLVFGAVGSPLLLRAIPRLPALALPELAIPAAAGLALYGIIRTFPHEDVGSSGGVPLAPGAGGGGTPGGSVADTTGSAEYGRASSSQDANKFSPIRAPTIEDFVRPGSPIREITPDELVFGTPIPEVNPHDSVRPGSPVREPGKSDAVRSGSPIEEPSIEDLVHTSSDGGRSEGVHGGIGGEVPVAAEDRSAGATRQGIVRNSARDWRALRDHWDDLGYGDILSAENREKINAGRTPQVDEAWIRTFPEDAGLKGERITMHHIGGHAVTIPLPKTRHLDAHMPGGYRYNPGEPGSSLPTYPPENGG